MVGAPVWRHYAPALQEIASNQTEIGLHLDLTQHPLRLKAQKLQGVIFRSWLRTFERTSLRSEIRAQLDAFEQHTGSPPAYVDGHQHVHQFPVVRDELLAELQLRYAGNLPWLRNTTRCFSTQPSQPDPWRQRAKSRVIEALGAAALAQNALAFGFRQNAHLLGVYDFTGDENSYFVCMKRWLKVCKTGALLMCHPSLEKYPDDILSSRTQEYKILSGDAFGELIEESGIRLEPMGKTLSRNAPKAYFEDRSI